MNIIVKRASVYVDGRRVAVLGYCGRAVTVTSASTGRRLGRIMPHGYVTGEPDGGLFDLWTAKHPQVYVPSDVIVAESVTVDDCVALLMEAELAPAVRLPVRLVMLQAFLIKSVHTTAHPRKGKQMTVQAETAEGTTAGTELAAVAPGAIARVKSGRPFTVFDLADLLAGPARRFQKEDALPGPAPRVEFTAVLRNALKALPDLFGQVMPDKARLLDRHEVKALTDEMNAITVIEEQLKQRKEAIKATMRNHQDFQGQEDGTASGSVRIAEGVAKGHLLLGRAGQPYETPVDGYADCWQQKMVRGKVEVDGSGIFDLFKAGLVEHEEMLAFTRVAGRVYDEDKAQAFIRKNPERGLKILAALTVRLAPSASLVSPKK